MEKYSVVIEKTANNYSAYVPDLPGCIATGYSQAQVEENISEAIAFHLEGLEEECMAVPSNAEAQVFALAESY